MFCGRRSFSRVDGDGDDSSPETWPSKKKTTRRTTKIICDKEEEKKTKKTRKTKKKKNNPYAGNGLDKFYALVAYLDARKQKIASPGDSLQAVWFKYSSSNDWKSLVVRLPPESWMSAHDKKKNRKTRSCCDSQASAGRKEWEVSRESATVAAAAQVEEDKVEEEAKRGGRGAGRHYWFWSMEVALALILLCLAVVGRSFAICCTILWWYFVPVALLGGDGGGRQKKKKTVTKRDEYQRKTMSLDRSMGRSAIPRQHQQPSIFRRETSYLSASRG